MPTDWSFITSPASVFSSSVTGTTTGLCKPSVGDLIVVGWTSIGLANAPVSPVISDNGSGGWSQFASIPITFLSDFGESGMTAAWWKVAAAADFNSGSGFTITIIGATGGTTDFIGFEADVFRLSAPEHFGGIDLAAQFIGTSDETSQSYSPASGSTEPSSLDQLAWTMTTGVNPGAITGSNTFTGTSAAANLALTGISGSTFLQTQFVGGVQASTTAGTNIFKNTWTNSRTPLLAGATFWVPVGGEQQVMIV